MQPNRSRGRPRSDSARGKILRAAGDMLRDGGLLSVTMEGAASRAGVGKPTVYRHFHNRHELAMAALMAATDGATDAYADENPMDALRAQLRETAALFASPTGRQVAQILASGYGETEISKAFRSHFVQAKRNEGRMLLEQAVDEGLVRCGVPIELVLDLIYGPIFYRLISGHADLGDQYSDELLDLALDGVGERSAGGG